MTADDDLRNLLERARMDARHRDPLYEDLLELRQIINGISEQVTDIERRVRWILDLVWILVLAIILPKLARWLGW